MSSLLIPFTDALLPQTLGAELQQPAAGFPAAFGVNAPFQALFPELLAGLATSLDGDSPSLPPDPKSTHRQTEFPVVDVGRRLCQPTALLDQTTSGQTGSDQKVDTLDPSQAAAVPICVGFLNLPTPTWTASPVPVLGETGGIGIKEHLDESPQPEEANAPDARRVAFAGSPLVQQPELPVPVEVLLVADNISMPPTMMSHARSDVPPELHVDIPKGQSPLLGPTGRRENNDTDRERTEADVVPDLAPTQTLPCVPNPEPLPLKPAASSASEPRGLDGVSGYPAEQRPSASRSDEAGEIGTKTSHRAFTSEGEHPEAREAFRLLLRNYSGNSTAKPTVPLAQTLPRAVALSTQTTTTAPNDPVKEPAEVDGSGTVGKSPESVRPAAPRTLTYAVGPRHAATQVTTESGSDKPIAVQPETNNGRHELPAASGPDLGRRQGDRNPQGREDESPVRNSASFEPVMKSVILPSREIANPHVEPQRIALPADAGIDSAPPTFSATEDQTPLVPLSRTVQQLRVTLPPTTEGPNVEVLLNQRGGGVEVSVRSPDPQVRETLRSGLSDLIGSFDRKGVAAEALPLTGSGHLSQVGQSQGLSEVGAGKALASQNVVETTEREMRDDTQQHQQRQAQWEPEGDNRRRRDQSAEAWQKYLEENAWRSL